MALLVAPRPSALRMAMVLNGAVRGRLAFCHDAHRLKSDGPDIVRAAVERPPATFGLSDWVQFPAYKKLSERDRRLETDEGYHVPPRGDLMPRRLSP